MQDTEMLIGKSLVCYKIPRYTLVSRYLDARYRNANYYLGILHQDNVLPSCFSVFLTKFLVYQYLGILYQDNDFPRCITVFFTKKMTFQLSSRYLAFYNNFQIKFEFNLTFSVSMYFCTLTEIIIIAKCGGYRAQSFLYVFSSYNVTHVNK